jgi:hypothetical protein
MDRSDRSERERRKVMTGDGSDSEMQVGPEIM